MEQQGILRRTGSPSRGSVPSDAPDCSSITEAPTYILILTLHLYLSEKLLLMDFPPDSAARASASEDGRRSGARRKATRRVEAIHAQELVQDDARDACRDARRKCPEHARRSLIEPTTLN